MFIFVSLFLGFSIVLLSRVHLSSFCSTGVQAKFLPYTLTYFNQLQDSSAAVISLVERSVCIRSKFESL